MASSLDLIQNQPIRFGYNAETCANNDNRAYCNLVQDGDYIMFQLKRILGTSLGCSLLDVSSTQLMTNSGFTGGAGAPWSLSGGWAYGTNDVAIAAGSGHVWQPVSALIDKAMYKVVVTTTATSLGGINIILSGVVIGQIPDSSLAGTFTFYGVADLSVNTNVGVNGTTITSTITSIELYQCASCFTFDVTDGIMTYNEFTGISINGTTNITVTLPFEPSSYYSPQTTAAINGYQTGTVEFGYNGAISGAINASNGDLTYTMNGQALDVLGISFTNFIGNISEFTFEQLSSDYYFGLYDLDGVFIQSLNAYVTYCREWVQVSFSPFDEGMNHGCYRIGLYDPYLHTDQLEFTYDFLTLGAAWTVDTGATWALVGGTGYRYTSANPNGAIHTDEAAPDFSSAWLKLLFETGTLSGAGIGVDSMGIGIDDGTFSGITSLSATAQSNTTYSNVSEGAPNITYNNFGNIHPSAFVTGTTAADVLIFQNAFYKIYPYHLDYLSNCFTFSESIPCSKLIYGLAGENLGFADNCGFAISKRFRAVRIIPSYNIKSTDFIGSDGTRILISGTGQKIYTILFDYMDELSHDVVMTLLLSKTIWIGEDYATVTTDGTRYFLIPQDYQPEWDKDGKLNLAMGRIQAIEYNQVKFTTNCQ